MAVINTMLQTVQRVKLAVVQNHSLHLLMAFRLLKPRQENCDLFVGTGSVITLQELSDGSEINRCLGNVGMFFEVYNAKWIEAEGERYKVGCILLTEIEADSRVPVFIHLKHIIVRDQHVWLIGDKLVTGDWCSHYHAWSVNKINAKETVCTTYCKIIHHLPLVSSTVSCDGNLLFLIGLHYRI